MKHKCHKQPPSKPQSPTRVGLRAKSTLVCVCFVFDKHEKRTENKIVLDVMRQSGVSEWKGAPKTESLKNSAT